MRKYSIYFAPLLLAGCATPDFNYQPEFLRVSEPAIGQEHVAYVGDAMLRQGKFMEYDAIYLKHPVDIFSNMTFDQGYYLKVGQDNDSTSFSPFPHSSEGNIYSKKPIHFTALMTFKNEPAKLCAIDAFNTKYCEAKVDFKITKKQVITTDTFQQTLIYSGKIGDKVNIGYREFTSNISRASFNNDVEYDLSASRNIAYKGARLEIIEATNEYIKYRVIKNFNKAAM